MVTVDPAVAQFVLVAVREEMRVRLVLCGRGTVVYNDGECTRRKVDQVIA